MNRIILSFQNIKIDVEEYQSNTYVFVNLHDSIDELVTYHILSNNRVPPNNDEESFSLVDLFYEGHIKPFSRSFQFIVSFNTTYLKNLALAVR